jgi:hypothetical protein
MNTRRLAYSLALLVPMVFGYACKGDGGDDVSFLQVTQTSPEDDALEVPVETRIGFRVNAPINPPSLTSETVFLTDNDGTVVPSTVSVGDEPDIVEMELDEPPLDVITTYTVTVTTGLTSRGGASLEEDFEWTFSTLDSEWGVSEWLEEIGTGTSSRQQIDVDGQLNALAVWQYTNENGSNIYANRYTRVDLWGDPVPIDDGSGGSTSPELATDDAGNGFVVWERSGGEGSPTNIWTNRYDVDDGWGTAALLQNGEVTPARRPSVAAAPAGNAIAVWIQRNIANTEDIVWAIRYEPGTGWGTATSIDDGNRAPLARGGTAVGMDDDGNAIAMWSLPATTGEVLWVNRYTVGAGWGTPELIKSDPATKVVSPRLAVGPNGDAFVIWVQNGDTYNDIWTVRFSGSNWGPPERIDSYEDGDKQEPDIAVDGTGVAHAVWSQADPDFANIWVNVYMPGLGWGTAQLLEPPNDNPNEDGDARTPCVDANRAGNTFVVWRQKWDQYGSVWSNRLDPGESWMTMTAEPIEDLQRTAQLPKIAVDENRHAHAVWLHELNLGIHWVRTNRFE